MKSKLEGKKMKIFESKWSKTQFTINKVGFETVNLSQSKSLIRLKSNKLKIKDLITTFQI